MPHLTPNILALLPEYILTLAGILIMLVEAVLKPGTTRKPLGWLAIFSTCIAGYASLYQLGIVRTLGYPLLAFSSSIQVDAFSIFFHLLIAAVVVATLLSSLDYFDGHASHAGEYYALVLFGSVGMMLMTCSTELLMVFIGLEISSISTYIMAGFRKSQASASESSLKYFLLGSFATAFFLYGIALAFGATGSTSIAAIAAALGTTATPRMAFLALAMMLIGLGFKVSAAPFHLWTPDVYQGAPAPIVGLMSTAPKAAAFAVLLRLTFSGFPHMQHRWSMLLWLLAAVSMTLGNLGALKQSDVKRLLAYSSIAHAGYLLVAFTAFPQAGIAAACFYTAAYAAMNVGAFAIVTQVSGYSETLRTIDDFKGLALRRPILSAVFAFFLLSLIGIPFTGGFFGKFYVFTSALQSGHVWLAVIGLLNSGVACFYYLRLLSSVYTRPEPLTAQDAGALTPADHALPGTPLTSRVPHSSQSHRDEWDVQTPLATSPATARVALPRISAPAALAILLTAAATLILGILPTRILHLANSAATTLTTAPPLNTTAAAPPVPIESATETASH
ncbi:MAG TPA: NADH-quinone oxidoreductase subunit NuoN [Acidobacteriaceae bacterium]|nr:NADH-quinone oxidoreductase subunit NuoN [Acidobacteriaceae bacterium]